MNLSVLAKFWPVLAVILGVFFLGLSLLVGFNRGLAQARALVTFENAKQVKLAMANFYSDNNRYPIAAEFSDPSIINAYLRNFPVSLPASAFCPQSFVYKQTSDTSYQLNFCLDAGVSGYQKGWNNVQY